MYYDESFWTDLVPKASMSQNAIKHCLVAISSFHEKLEAFQTVSDTSRHMQYSLQHYGKAIHLLRTATGLLSTEETLISCILFIWFENLQNNLKNSRRHIESGLGILAEVRRTQRTNTAELIDTIIAPTLGRLKIKADIFSEFGELGLPSDRQHFIPERFLTVAQARQSLAHLITWICSVLRHMPFSRSNSKNWQQRTSILARRLSGFDLFSARLEDLLRATRAAQEPEKLQAILLLKINDLVVRIIVSSYLYLQDCASGRQRSFFSQIVDSCEEYLTIESIKDKATSSKAYSIAGDLVLETGIIRHLLFASAHCRSHSLRQRVVDLLAKYPRREGPWDSLIASKVASQIARLEKQDLMLPLRVPEGVAEFDIIRVLSICFYHPEEHRTRFDKTGDAEQRNPFWDLHGNPTFPTRLKILFVRFPQSVPEPLVEELWMDESGKSVLVRSISSSHDVSSFYSGANACFCFEPIVSFSLNKNSKAHSLPCLLQASFLWQR